MISFEDYRDEKGNIDWSKYHEAQINAGEKCYKCGSYISSIFNKSKFRSLCSECESLNDKEEVRHESLVRCPKCGESWNPSDRDDFELYEEGEHEVICSECNHEFTITTEISYTFTSPELIEKEEDKEESEG